VLLARWLPTESYGAFAVGFAGYLLLAGFHNVLILEPLSVIGPARHSNDLPNYFRAQVAVHTFLVLPLSALALIAALVFRHYAPANPLVGALAGGGVALPFLLFLWLARRMCYVLQRPGLAVAGSSVLFVTAIVLLAGLKIAGRVDPFTAFVSNGLASFLGAAWITRKIGLASTPRCGSAFQNALQVFRENWYYGRWLVGSTLLYFASSQAQTFLLAAFLGLGAAGALRATQVPALIVQQTITAVGMLALPSFAFDFGLGRLRHMQVKAGFLSFGLGAATLFVVLVLAVWAKPIEHVLFGGKYRADAWLMPLLALVPCANAVATGYSMVLRASQRPHFDLLANSIAAPVGLTSAVLLMRGFGLAGAVVSMVLAATTVALVTFISYRVALGSGVDD
jgi:O-antigen/teichoic acid export membrane protein